MTSFRPFSHMRNGKKVLAAFGQVSSGALAAAAMAAVLPGSVAHAQAITPPATVNTGTASSSELTHKLSAVRRQNIWLNWRRKLAECGLRLRVDIMRRSCGVASADARWSVV